MLIIENFLDSELLNDLEKDLESKIKQRVWVNSRTSWQDELTNRFIGNIETTSIDPSCSVRLEKKIKPLVDSYVKFAADHYIWYPLSGINLHKDEYYQFGATLYLNKNWNVEDGGLFLYKKKEKYKVVVPTYNTCVINDNNIEHCVTQVTSRNNLLRHTIQIWGTFN